MKTRELIIEENNNDKLDAIYCLLRSIEEDLKKYSIEEILLDSLELKNYE